MKRLYAIAATALLSATLAGCIRNDIPYPRIEARFTAFELEGETAPAEIDTEKRTVTVTLDEPVDLRAVPVKTISYTPEASCSMSFGETIDLSEPIQVRLTIYQDYFWTIRAEQPIARSFEVEGQIGVADIDPQARRAVAFVTTRTDLSRVQVTSLKLGPRGITTMSPAMEELTDFTEEQSVRLQYRDVQQTWRLYVVHSPTAVSMRSAEVWTHVAWLAASGIAGGENGFRYREAAAEQWVEVSHEQIVTSGGNFSARLTGLKASTAYEYYAYSGEERTETASFTTDAAVELPDGGFDAWHKTGKVWNPWSEGGLSFWDTGNKGATTIDESVSVPSDDTHPSNPSGKAACLASRFVGIASIGRLAAGNIFVGEYVRTDGMNGVLNFGRPFTARPTRLKGYFKYQPRPINYVNEVFQGLGFEGKNDTCIIYVALGDWSAPVEIRTKASERKLFNRNDEHVIAYGEMICGEAVGEYREFSIELEYRATDRRPTHLVCVASASKWGDYFTGGDGSTLVIDEFSLEYDY